MSAPFATPFVPSTVVSTVNAIVGLSAVGLTDGIAIRAQGRTTAGDGGGGNFRYSASSAATADNGIVFAPSQGSGRFLREGYTTSGFLGGTINVAWFGASPANADNQPAFNAAVAYFANGTDCSILVPDGTYTISAALTVGTRNITWIFGSTTVISFTSGSLPGLISQPAAGTRSTRIYSSKTGATVISQAGTAGYNTRWLYAQLNINGTSTAADVSGQHSAVGWNITADTAVMPNGQSFDGLHVLHTVSTGASGARRVIHGRVAVVGVLANGKDNMVAGVFDGFTQSNQGGTGTITGGDIDTGWVGALTGLNPTVWHTATSTFQRNLVGMEANVGIYPGGSSWCKWGVAAINSNFDAVRGTTDDMAFTVGTQAGGISWQHGLCFNFSWGQWPFDTTSTMIGAKRQAYPSTDLYGPAVANYGVDFSQVAFTTAAWKSPGFSILPLGAVAITPETTATPAVNGELRFEATSNTSFKICYRGSDGTVRKSASITLS